jgi:hypothetical protein
MNVKAIGSLAAAVAVGASLLMTPTVASARDSFSLEVSTKSPKVKYFDYFSYDRARVQGTDPDMARTLTRKVTRFTMPRANEFLKPSAKTRKYLRKARPAAFGSGIKATRGCHRNYICLSQESAFSTPILAGSVTDIQARAWSTRTGKPAKLQDFVSPDRLPAFTERVKRAIRQADCFYGFPITLPARYESFPNWVPLKKGVRVWFPEYEFGCQIMALKVPWS